MVEGEVGRRLIRGGSAVPPGEWHLGWLVACPILSVALLASKFLPPFAGLWQRVDLAVFELTNASLLSGNAWQWLWALTNHRAFDAVAGGFFLVIFLCYIVKARGRARVERFAAGGFLFAWTVIVLDVSSNWIFDFRHPSPTLVVVDAVRLSELVPQFKLKDSSGASFPGDHGTALIMFTVMIWFYAGRRPGLLAAAGASLFALPRLMSGAHWLSDIAVGSVSVALIALALALATPLHAVAVRWISWPLWKAIEWLMVKLSRPRGRSREET
ncbi:MAG: phosphatase PAP2 family protein [Gammaproteobacteria bacterium]|nr:phosphatase PAP2 family protein [Gammaproteobacteria bacterium]